MGGRTDTLADKQGSCVGSVNRGFAFFPPPGHASTCLAALKRFFLGAEIKRCDGTDQDRWLIVKKLGEGQFAEVYEVKDTMDGDKRVRRGAAGTAAPGTS
ncbi:hypothetical protein Vretimale_13534 [Volvox reticuliferus]|uniref:Protein kinase domain-containing protein n=1 Tax=Volvox reticuliferus TaxID=1737510 RepID=A0A8J4GLL9_9CHLO|nr:hypothetical protein Vretimale_13534 [Volvox reticuliferus]